jgi:hypothetical protein
MLGGPWRQTTLSNGPMLECRSRTANNNHAKYSSRQSGKRKDTEATNELSRVRSFHCVALRRCASYIPKACLVCTCSASFNDSQRFALRRADQVLGLGKWIAGLQPLDYQDGWMGAKDGSR